LPSALQGAIGAGSDEERAMAYVLRILDRVITPGTLSPVERAFVAGARVMFDELSKACRTMIRRKPADLIHGMAKPGQKPRSVGNPGGGPAPSPAPKTRAAKPPASPAPKSSRRGKRRS
jgi:hypothetical protein